MDGFPLAPMPCNGLQVGPRLRDILNLILYLAPARRLVEEHAEQEG